MWTSQGPSGRKEENDAQRKDRTNEHGGRPRRAARGAPTPADSRKRFQEKGKPPRRKGRQSAKAWSRWSPTAAFRFNSPGFRNPKWRAAAAHGRTERARPSPQRSAPPAGERMDRGGRARRESFLHRRPSPSFARERSSKSA